MKLTSLLLAGLWLVVSLAVVPAPAASPPDTSPPELTGSETPEQIQAAYSGTLAAILPNILEPDGRGVRQLETLVHTAARPGAERERAACCLAIAAALETDLPPLAKAWLARQLVTAGKSESVPVLTKMLSGGDALLREEARRALQHNPAPEALDVLRTAAAGATDTAWREALNLALHARGEQVPLPPRPLPDRSVRHAELVARIRAAGDEAAPVLVELLGGDDADGRTLALGQIAFVPPVVLRAVAEAVPSLPQPTRLLVVQALADRREPAALPAALACARSDDQEMRLAGIEALGPLGDVSVLPLLLDAIATGGDAGGAARRSVTRITDPRVNVRLVELLKDAPDEAERNRILELVLSREVTEAAEVLLPMLMADEARVRQPAARALGRLAQPRHVPAMLAGLPQTSGGERDDLERAIMFVCQRAPSPDERADAIIAAYESGSLDKTLLLPVLGRVGSDKAAAVVREALSSRVPEVRQAAIRGLCNWPDASVAPDLEKLARELTDPGQRSAALRALVRVVTLPGELSTKEQLAYLRTGFELASTEPDRNWVLERAHNVRHLETFRMVLPYLDDPAHAVRAGRSICELAHHGGLRSSEKEEYQAALRKVIQVCGEDQNLTARAKDLLEANP